MVPHHYHLLVRCQPFSVISRPLRRVHARTARLFSVAGEVSQPRPLRRVHARTARELNRRDGQKRRKIWHLFSDRQVRNERHYYTTLNYIHYNPTKHNYAKRLLDWDCSSLHWYEKQFGIEWLRDLWRQYPILDYGKGWD